MTENIPAKPLVELVRELPPDEQMVVREFVEFLLDRRRSAPTNRSMRQNWAGGLRAYRQQFTARDLQKHSLEWRNKN
jgi:hypothetical protein